MSKISKEKHSVYLSFETMNYLEELKSYFGYSYFKDKTYHKKIVKRSNSTLSTFIKSIIINTHIYLENTDILINDKISYLLKQESFDFIKKRYNKILNDDTFKDFIKEVIKQSLIDYYLDTLKDLTKNNEFQFRTDSYTTYDFEELSSYINSSSFKYNKVDYFNFLVHFFVNINSKTKEEIMYYQVNERINQALKRGHTIKINNTIIKPFSLFCHLTSKNQTLLGINSYTNEFVLISYNSIYSIEEFGVLNSLTDDEIDKLSIISNTIKDNKIESVCDTYIKVNTNEQVIHKLENKYQGIKIKIISDDVYLLNILPIYLVDIISTFKNDLVILSSSKNIEEIIKIIK